MNELTQIIQDTTLITNVIPDIIWTNIPTWIKTGVKIVVPGVFIFVLSYIIKKFIIDPLLNYNEIKGQLAEILIKCDNVYVKGFEGILENDFELTKKTSDIAGKIVVSSNKVKLYKFLNLIKLIPSKINIEKAAKDLMKISGLIQQNDKGNNKGIDIIDPIKNIQRNLKIEPIDYEYFNSLKNQN